MISEAQWIHSAIEELATTAVKADGIYHRATYTKEDQDSLTLLIRWMSEGGLSHYFDTGGNLFGRIDGEEQGIILTGSHRDTVKNGGKYDGALGLLTSLAAVSALYRELGRPKKTVEVVATAEEEGNRFLSSYIGSRTIAGELGEKLLLEQDSEGITLEEALSAHGYFKGVMPGPKEHLERFVELHIEQGPVLDKEKKDIGIVTAIVGILSGSITFSGQQNHAGTTPMNLRKDPMPYMCRFVNEMLNWVEPHSGRMVFTVGRVTVRPGAPNVIAESVEITYDIRTIDPMLLSEAQEALFRIAETVGTSSQGAVDVIVYCPCKDRPVDMDAEGIAMLERILKGRQMDYNFMCSGAGHDAQVIGKKVKTNMIFVPSVSGISHSVNEYTSKKNIEKGYVVLKEFLKQLAWGD